MDRRHFLEARPLRRNNCKLACRAGSQIGGLGDMMLSAGPSRTTCIKLVLRAELQMSVRSIITILHPYAAV